MDKYTEQFADFLNGYDNSIERECLMTLLNNHGLSSKEFVQIADIGCGTGRSILTLLQLFPSADIVGIDCKPESIRYSTNHNYSEKVSLYTKDAFLFLKEIENKNKFDLLLFSWSLFDIVSSYCNKLKSKKIREVLGLAKHCLKDNGCIIVTQPTKGGIFEKLLSVFMPESDDDYFITYQSLIDNGFLGPSNALPSEDDPFAIWSNFICSRSQLISGIEAIVKLETGESIAQSDIDREVESFLSSYNFDEDIYKLSDCVGLYFWNKNLQSKTNNL